MNTATQQVMFSSASDGWETPQDLFDKLDIRFNFTLDPCATSRNKKCNKFYTEAEDGLIKNWGGESVFCNPPYGREVKKWVKKCYEESLKPNTTVVMLIPSRTDTTWWHDYIMHAAEIIFIKGRLKFGDSKNSAPFPSAIIVFKNNQAPVLKTMGS
jgi:site-specific DNA-methyltransferase (adenine-specific)